MTNKKFIVKEGFLYLPQLEGKTPMGEAQVFVKKHSGITRYRQIKDRQYTGNVLVKNKSGKEELRTKASLVNRLKSVKAFA